MSRENRHRLALFFLATLVWFAPIHLDRMEFGQLGLGRCVFGQWTEFRGGRLQGVADSQDLPLNWSESENVLWSVPLIGRGNSSPIVTDHDVFVTTQDENRDLWVCDVSVRSGKFVWRKKVGQGSISATGPARLYAHRHNAATPTPVTDGENVFAFFGNGEFVCLDYRGEIVWQRNLVTDYGPFDLAFGMASSPCWFAGNLTLPCINKRSSYIIHLSPRTGKTQLKIDRDFYAKADGRDAYSTPVVAEASSEILIVAGADTINSYQYFARDRFRELGKYSNLGIDSDHGRIIASPTIYENKVIATTANPLGGVGKVVAYTISYSGNFTLEWEYKKYTPDSSTPVCYKDRVYMVRDDGIATCLKLTTGELMWRKRLGKGPFHSSPVVSDDRVYFLSRDGTCYIVAANDKGDVLSENQLPGDFYATPAISNGVIYFRSDSHLYAVGQRSKSDGQTPSR